MTTQVHSTPAKPLPKLTEAELNRQIQIFETARDVKRLREEIHAYDSKRARYRMSLEQQLKDAEAKLNTLTAEAVAQAVRS